MRERFSKLLLGEDMSGCGKGVSTALAISNAITNLCGMFFFDLLCEIGYGDCVKLCIYRSSAFLSPNFGLVATIFGQLWRLEPLSPEKKSMWRREMEWLVCVSDHIVELIPSWQTFPDGTKLEVLKFPKVPHGFLYIFVPVGETIC